MPDKIIGRFYFKQTSNSNLIGEFSNDHSDRILTESADLRDDSRKSRNGSSYIGDYYSTWQEDGKPILADLTITAKPEGTNSNLFSLTWRRHGKPVFEGEAMLCDNIL